MIPRSSPQVVPPPHKRVGRLKEGRAQEGTCGGGGSPGPLRLRPHNPRGGGLRGLIDPDTILPGPCRRQASPLTWENLPRLDDQIYDPVTMTGLGLTLTVMVGPVGDVVPPFGLREPFAGRRLTSRRGR